MVVIVKFKDIITLTPKFDKEKGLFGTHMAMSSKDFEDRVGRKKTMTGYDFDLTGTSIKDWIEIGRPMVFLEKNAKEIFELSKKLRTLDSLEEKNGN